MALHQCFHYKKFSQQKQAQVKACLNEFKSATQVQRKFRATYNRSRITAAIETVDSAMRHKTWLETVCRHVCVALGYWCVH